MASETDRDKGGTADETGAEGRAAEPKGHAISRRTAIRLAGVAAGGILAAGFVGYEHATDTPESARTYSTQMYEYIQDRPKFKSPDFMLGNRLADSILTFGSSDFATFPGEISTVPRAQFGWYDHGLDLWCVGEGYNQSLWHAVAMAAYSEAISRTPAPADAMPEGVFDARMSNKAVFIISPQWFFEGGVPANATQAQYGFGLWRLACQNANVDPSRLDYLEGRLKAEGIDARQLAAPRHATLPDTLNDYAFDFEETHRISTQLDYTRSHGDTILWPKHHLTAKDGVPDWETLATQAVEEGARQSANNDFGMLDSYWAEKNADDFAAGKLQGFLKNRTLLKAPTEDADLDCALGVASDCGFDLLCVLLPFPGDWADYEQLDRGIREQRYELMREACARWGVRVADFTGEEYTRYFIYDGTHLGWLGWVRVEQAIYEFALGA